MNLKHPEIFDFSDPQKWTEKFIRKELSTMEWDLSLWEVAPDIFRIPAFTPEFCDKIIETYKDQRGDMVDTWDTTVESLSLVEGLKESMRGVIADYLIHAIFHAWKVESGAIHKLKWDYTLYRFKKNQDLRVRHDGAFLTTFINLDEKTKGGQLYFPKYNFELKPEQGVCYFFPQILTHRYGLKNFESDRTHYFVTYLKFDGSS